MSKDERITYHPTICITQKCNLNCKYCYQHHDNRSMVFDTAKRCIDEIFQKDAADADRIEVNFIGGEPLLEYDLLKKLFEYTKVTYNKPFYFFATTNGTLLNENMKNWFIDHKYDFILGLSLDGDKETHDYNRSNSFNKIDIDFFRTTYPLQNVKMTLTEFSLKHFAKAVKYIHSRGFDFIGGVNLYEGTFDWSKDEYLYVLIPQLNELVEYYLVNPNQANQMFKKSLAGLEANNIRKPKKYCGIGTGTAFYDVDGTKQPCSYCTPMTFDSETLEKISKTDFSTPENFIDKDCFNNCYIYPICPHCSGANYLATGSFSKWDKSKCKIQKLIALFIADLEAKKVISDPKLYDKAKTYHTINAIKKIRELYLPDLEKIFKSAEEIERIKERIISAGEISKGNWRRRKWTADLNNCFIDYWIKKNYSVYCKTKGATGKEWLYDITICKQTEDSIDETYLVAESEWNLNEEDIWYDFQKLLLSNSNYKVMIFQQKTIEEQEKMFTDMTKQIKSYKKCNGIFILACYTKDYGYDFELVNCNNVN